MASQVSSDTSATHLFSQASDSPQEQEFHGVTGPSRSPSSFLDNAFKERIIELEKSVFDPDQNAQPLIQLLSQVHNGNPESRFVYAAMLARGIAVDENPKEALALFEYAARMDIPVPEIYIAELNASLAKE